jgi:hypothetical protein
VTSFLVAGGADPPLFLSTPIPWSGIEPLDINRFSLDRLELTQTISGLVLGLIALFSSNDHITFVGRSVPLQQQWGIPFIFALDSDSFYRVLATRRRHLGATLNWRRDPGYELRMQQRKWRTKQIEIEIEILRVRSDSEEIRKETEQIETETEQL